MDRRERGGSQVEGVIAALQGLQATMWTAMPGIIQSFDPDKQTAVVQVTIKSQVQKPDGSFEWVQLPPLVDCPVYFPRGGGYVLTFPVAAEDECLVVFASRCIDAWWQSGGIDNVQAELRMHDLSDGFVFAGFSSVPMVTPAIAVDAVELRDVAGTSSVRIDADGLTVTAPIVNINGVLIINGTPFLAHTHSGVTAGGAHTGGVP